MRHTPPPYYRVNVTGPAGTLAYRKRAADEYNKLRLDLEVSDRTLADMLEPGKGALGRWGKGEVEVPYWVILRLRALVAAESETTAPRH